MANNQYFKETLNKLSTSIDLTNPVGLEMSDAFDKYVEKVIKPIYPKGTKIRQTSNVDDATGLRTVDWSFKDTNNKIEQAVRAAVDNFTQSWGKARGLLDEAGNPVPDTAGVPMRVSGITPQVFNGTRTRILNPRTAASVARAVTVAGGDFITDKNTGISTWSVPDSALTRDGKNLSRSLRGQIREGDKRWLEGKVALSSLAEGASPANADERAIAMNNRNYRVLLAKYKAMTPEQEKQEDFLRLTRAGQRYASEREYERLHPFDPRVQAKRLAVQEKYYTRQNRRFSRSVSRMKQTGQRAVHMARSAVLVAIGSILGTLGAVVSLLGKISTTVIDIGKDVRRQTMSDMRYNFDEGFTRDWELFAEKRGFDKEVLSQAAGGISSAWSSPLNYSSSNFDTLAPYLRDSTRILVRQATASGDKNVLHIMSGVIDDLVGKSLSGMAGTKQYTGQSRMTAAFTENMSALQNHNGAWAQLMQYYWNDLIEPGDKFRTAAVAAGEDVSFESWLRQGRWNPEFMERGNGLTNPPVKDAAERTYEAVNSLKTSLGSLQTNVLERIAGSVAQVAEDVRSKISNLLARYFPAFAMKEKERAGYLNAQALVNAENNLPGYKATAEAGLKATGYTGSLEDFRGIYEGIMKRDPEALALLPRNVNLDALDAFMRYQAPAYYETSNAVQDITKENDKMAEKQNYVPRVIVYDPVSNATRFTSLGMAAGFGLQNIRVRQQAPEVSSGGIGIGDFLRRLWAGGPIDTNPDRPVYEMLNFLGLQLVTDVMTGNLIGKHASNPAWPDVVFGKVNEEDTKVALSYRIQGAYNRYKDYEERIKGYKNVSENGVLLMSPNGKLLSELQAKQVTNNFHAAEKELYGYLAAMYDTKNPQFVLNAYDLLAGFYHDYGHFARVTDPRRASEMRARIREDTSGVLLGDWVADISTVFSPSEVMTILRDERAKYIRLNHLEGELSAYQASQTLPLQAIKQNLTNDATIPIALIEQTNAKLLGRPDLPNSVFDVLQMSGVQGLTFDVDEEAIRNRTAAVTNVFLEIRGRSPIKILEAVNTGLSRDVRVVPGQDTFQALLEALSATQ
jgi:hypothetical protein